LGVAKAHTVAEKLIALKIIYCSAMASDIPDNIILYRITHINNIAFILRNGMFTHGHPEADSNYISIGDTSLIIQRNDLAIPVDPPGGMLGEYIPFYFGSLSPMLLNIKTGHRGIKQRPQSDIVYICCRLEDVIRLCNKWCFTNGHAKNAFTEFYNNLSFLTEIDWNLVSERYWANTDEDFDRMRRKQAEFLIKNHVSPACINHIIVYSAEVQSLVERMVGALGLTITVSVNPDNRFYY
jgi:ssDNA thymidine ADP-ribosyltransferase, DarT